MSDTTPGQQCTNCVLQVWGTTDAPSTSARTTKVLNCISYRIFSSTVARSYQTTVTQVCPTGNLPNATAGDITVATWAASSLKSLDCPSSGAATAQQPIAGAVAAALALLATTIAWRSQ